MLENITLKNSWLCMVFFLLGAGITDLVFSSSNGQAMTLWGKVAFVNGAVMLGAFVIVQRGK